MTPELLYVDEQVPGIRCHAVYATADNFTGAPVEGYDGARVVGTRALCDGLVRVQSGAASYGLGLLVWDAYRPQRAVDAFLRWSQQPEDGLTTARHHPHVDRAELFEQGYIAERSGHSRGSSVDLTLVDLATGDPMDMGGHHDLMDPVSHHGAPGVPSLATANRRLLCALMEAGGFERYDREWWHYTLVHEPYPDRYFDVPIS